MTDLEQPDTATPAYALRELANWIEHRTGGTEPRDQTRIELGRTMADNLDAFTERQQSMIETLLQERKAVLPKLEELVAIFTVESPAGDALIGADVPNDAGSGTIAPFQVAVAGTPAKPVDDHKCTTLTFNRDMMTGITRVRCDLERETKIDLGTFERMAGSHRDVIMSMARQIAADHNCNLQQLHSRMEGSSPNDLMTITVGTTSSSPQTQDGGSSKET